MKRLFSIALILSSLSVNAQNDPTIQSYTVDTLCSGDFQALAITVTIEDLDGDSTYFLGVTNSDTYFGSSFTVVEPPYSAGANLRTFQILANAGFGMAQGVNLASINILVVGNTALDPDTLNQSINDLQIYGSLGVTIDMSGVSFCTSDNLVDISPWVSPAGGITVHGANADITFVNSFDPEAFYNDSGDGLFYTWTNAKGCSEEVSDWPTVFVAPDVAISTANSTCGSADGSATATVTGQFPPFDVFWTTGFNEQVSVSSAVSNLSSGTYYVNVYDANGCNAQGPAQISDSDLTVTTTITDQTCPDAGNGAIDLTISGGTVDDIYWSNGMSTEDITGLAAGEYSVSIHTTSNCQAFYTYFISNPAPLGITVINIAAEDCSIGLTSSLIDISTWGGSGSYNWDWDSGSNLSEDFTNPGVGVHNCVVTDQVTGCSWSWAANVPDYGAPYVYFADVVKPNCNQNNGGIDAVVNVNINPIASISWSTGATTEDISGIGPGEYIVTVTDTAGCFTSEAVTVEDALPYQPTICLLTVDTSFTYNQVVWEKDIAQTVTGFNVYRETQQLGVFEQVANRPYALESSFMDNSASPQDRSWRYYITTYDDCGNESYPSFIHKTIHTVAVAAGGSNFDVFWDKYEGISYSDVDLYRFDATNGWQNIGNFSNTTLQFTDTPSITTGLDYIVSFNLINTCTSTKAATDYNSSRSNSTSATYDPGNSTLNIENEDLGEISIYPNPTNGLLNVIIENPSKIERIEIRDLNGRLILSRNVYAAQSSFELSYLADGVYFVRFISSELILNKKFIIE
jgi:Secretion system C-terminal sorting domain